MIKLCVLGSTRGTDLQAIIDSIESGELDAKISLVISNKKNAFILERARKHGLKTIFLDSKNIKPRDVYDSKLIELIDEESVDLILLIGWMRILSKKFVNHFKNKIINIHPSLLPEFAGGMDANVHEEVLKAGKEFTGCTLHFVTENVDEGPIILQKKVKVLKNDSVESLKKRVQLAEQEIIIKAIKLFNEKKISVVGNEVIINEN